MISDDANNGLLVPIKQWHSVTERAEFDQAKQALFSSFGITDTEYAMYMGTNGRAVNAYLEANPDIKQQIDDLSVQVRSLPEEYESLKGSGEPEVPPLP